MKHLLSGLLALTISFSAGCTIDPADGAVFIDATKADVLGYASGSLRNVNLLAGPMETTNYSIVAQTKASYMPSATLDGITGYAFSFHDVDLTPYMTDCDGVSTDTQVWIKTQQQVSPWAYQDNESVVGDWYNCWYDPLRGNKGWMGFLTYCLGKDSPAVLVTLPGTCCVPTQWADPNNPPPPQCPSGLGYPPDRCCLTNQTEEQQWDTDRLGGMTRCSWDSSGPAVCAYTGCDPLKPLVGLNSQGECPSLYHFVGQNPGILCSSNFQPLACKPNTSQP